VVQARGRGDDDRIGHCAEVAERLVAVLALAEVDLSQGVQSGLVGDVDEVGDLDSVAGREVQPAQQVGVCGDLTGQRLIEAGQAWRVEV
jgi:hypothetical protein